MTLKGLVVVVEEHSNYTLVFSLCCRPLAGYHLFVKTLGPCGRDSSKTAFISDSDFLKTTSPEKHIL
jgi:hypothetical protein